MNVVVGLTVFSAIVHSAVCAQVFVKFLTPPHGYTHNLQLNTRDGVAVAKEERIYPNPSESRTKAYQMQTRFHPHRLSSPQTTYYYPRPAKPFDAYGLQPYPAQYQDEQVFHPPAPHSGFAPGRFSGGVGSDLLQNTPPPEPYLPTGEYMNPDVMGLSQHEAEVSYDPLLITGPQAAQYVSYLFSKGELFFNLIPHERLVLMNQRDRVENNLLPHLLASIRPGHPFFIHR